MASSAVAVDARTTLLHLTDVAHTLKVDPSRTTANYGADMPFSPQLRQALSDWSTS